MALSIGTRIGSSEILAPLGAGGMGEVCRAHDTELDREAAIKVLPPAFAHDPERLARLKHEAKVLLSWIEPNRFGKSRRYFMVRKRLSEYGLPGMCLSQVIAMAAARVGRSPWTARDAFVPLPEAGRRSNAPAPRNAARPYPPESSTYPATDYRRRHGGGYASWSRQDRPAEVPPALTSSPRRDLHGE